MTLLELLLLLLIAGITGSLAQSLVGINRGGCFISILVGFIGALVGSWLGRYLDLPEIWIITIGEIDYPVFWSLLGAVVCTGFIAIVSPRKV